MGQIDIRSQYVKDNPDEFDHHETDLIVYATDKASDTIRGAADHTCDTDCDPGNCAIQHALEFHSVEEMAYIDYVPGD